MVEGVEVEVEVEGPAVSGPAAGGLMGDAVVRGLGSEGMGEEEDGGSPEDEVGRCTGALSLKAAREEV